MYISTFTPRLASPTAPQFGAIDPRKFHFNPPWGVKSKPEERHDALDIIVERLLDQPTDSPFGLENPAIMAAVKAVGKELGIHRGIGSTVEKAIKADFFYVLEQYRAEHKAARTEGRLEWDGGDDGLPPSGPAVPE